MLEISSSLFELYLLAIVIATMEQKKIKKQIVEIIDMILDPPLDTTTVVPLVYAGLYKY